MAFPATNKINYCAFIFLLVGLFQRKNETQCDVKVAKTGTKDMFYASSWKIYALNSRHTEYVPPTYRNWSSNFVIETINEA